MVGCKIYSGYFMSNIRNRARPNIGYFVFVKANFLKNIQMSIMPFLFTNNIINIIWYHVMSCIVFLELHIELCVWDKINLLKGLP